MSLLHFCIGMLSALLFLQLPILHSAQARSVLVLKKKALNEGKKQDQEKVFYQKLNQFRTILGLSPLELNPSLQKAARDHSLFMAKQNYLTHDEPEPRLSSYQRMVADGFSANSSTGENIACGNWSGVLSLKQLLLSRHHLHTMLDPHYHFTGIAREDTEEEGCRYFWTNDFAGVRNDLPEPEITLEQVIKAIETVCGPLDDDEIKKVKI